MKGVSPVVATVLMVAVAIAAAVVAYSWFMSMQASVQAEASRGAAEVGKELVNIDAVKCESNAADGDANLIVYVRNVGETPIDGNLVFEIKNATSGATLGVAKGPVSNLGSGSVEEVVLDKLYDGSSDVYDAVQDCNATSEIIVTVTTPGGAVASARAKLS